MSKDIRTALSRSRDTILFDALGAVSLGLILFVGLSLPGLF